MTRRAHPMHISVSVREAKRKSRPRRDRLRARQAREFWLGDRAERAAEAENLRHDLWELDERMYNEAVDARASRIWLVRIFTPIPRREDYDSLRRSHLSWMIPA